MAMVSVDWRRPYMQRIIQDFPGLSQGHIRRVLAMALARPLTPGEAAASVSDAAQGLTLSADERHRVTLLVCALENQSVQESEI